MKIARVETIVLAVPFDTGSGATALARQSWTHLDTIIVRVHTEDGRVGVGEAFSYHCRDAVQAALDHMIAPMAVGRDARDIAALMRDLQQALHLFGRYGVVMFALSGLDIALWDLAAKAADMPLRNLLGGTTHTSLPAYASLFRYGDPDRVAERCRGALVEGYRHVKLHEVTEPAVRAAREALGDGPALMVDTNCPWTPREAMQAARTFAPYDLYWLEEPVFPPEDFDALARVGRETGVPIAAGENACTAYEFQKMFAADAVSFAQPSVTKVGGITELMRVADLARAAGVSLMPHSPYFGPGFLATLQLAAALPETGLIERFHLEPEGRLYGDLIDPVDGAFRLPEGPGLGMEPDEDVIREYRVAAA